MARPRIGPKKSKTLGIPVAPAHKRALVGIAKFRGDKITYTSVARDYIIEGIERDKKLVPDQAVK